MEPMLLKPVGKDYLWGGLRLKTEYGKKMGMVPLAETWECSTHPDGMSTVVNGEFAGWTLREVLGRHPEYLGTKAQGELPILVKFIDAEKDLSVQVHPGDEYARTFERQNGKTEMWYVLDAKPGASLICGFAHDMTRELLKEAIENKELDKQLQKVDVHKGDVFFIPAGTVHAIGAGALVAEIQESSNVTYRVYDYDRTDKDGKRRELHFDKAMEVLNLKSGVDVRQKPRMVRYYPGCSRELLCRCQYFDTERIQISMAFSFSVLENSFQVLLCLEGEGQLEIGGQGEADEGRGQGEGAKKADALHFGKGDCVFLPAAIGRCHISGRAELLKIRC